MDHLGGIFYMEGNYVTLLEHIYYTVGEGEERVEQSVRTRMRGSEVDGIVPREDHSSIISLSPRQSH